MTARIVTVDEGPRLARSISVGQHRLAADEPEPVSTDTGPTPGELLLAALGACTSMTVRAFADRHNWPLDRVDVAVRFDAQGQIVKDVRLTGSLEAAHFQQLFTVAGRCPVHRLLSKESSIITVPTVVAKPAAAHSQTLPE
ncbi:OsmC family protein [Streptomyces sp. NPDC127036]|uniref:OsmC family protein n=1 Tax=unclassified Streptomyces TaxID=2593676 RepID=UPI00365F3D28